MKIAFSPPDITEEEIEAVAEVLRSGWITTGPKTKKFEEKIAEISNTRRGVALNSATACMEMTLHLLGIGPGDEVITTAYTYTATASCICHVGARPVIVDTIKGEYWMDPEKVEAAITEKTKGIIPVDLGGIIYPYYDKLYEVIESKKEIFVPKSKLQKGMGRIAVIADSAHSVGAKRQNRSNGTWADFTCYSFHAVKNLTTGEGGGLTWNVSEEWDEEIYKEYMLLSLHGQSKDALAKTRLGSWEYDVVAPYYKCNMTDIAAGIGLVQYQRYPEILRRRKEIINQYNEGLQELGIHTLPHYCEGNESAGHLYLTRIPGITLEERNCFIEEMAERGIATNVHYKPLPLLTAYKNQGYQIEDYPNAFEMYQNEVTLPLHTKLTDEEVSYIIKNYKEALRSIQK